MSLQGTFQANAEVGYDHAAASAAREEREATITNDLNRGGEESARAGNVRVSAVGMGREETYAERKKREDRFRDAILRNQLTPEAQALHGALGDYANDLRDEQRRIERRMAELRDRGEARDAISELIATGALDRDNAEHQVLLDRAGLNPDQSDDELRNTIDRDAAQDGQEYDALAARHAEIERQLPLVEAARERIANGEDPDDVLRDLADQGIHIEVDPTDELQVRRGIVARGQDLTTELDELHAVDEGESDIAEPAQNAEQEVAEFMLALANNQQMMLSGTALQGAMRNQIEGLSEEAREQLENSEETAFLFEQSEVQSAEPAQDATAPIEDQRPDQSSGIVPGSTL